LVAAPPKANPTQTVNGWLVHWPDPAYLDRVLEAAPHYQVNHLELSHDIIMEIDQANAVPERGKLIESVAQRAKARGMKTYLWAHEINTRDKNAPLDPESPDGKAFLGAAAGGVSTHIESLPVCRWDRVDVRLRSLLGLGAPLQAGSRVTAGSAGSRRNGFASSPDLSAMSSPKSSKRGVCSRLQSRAGGVGFDPGSADGSSGAYAHLQSRAAGFSAFLSHSFTLGAYGSTPQIVELDLCGEYWGQSLIVTSQAEYLPYRLKHDQAQGTVGAVGRVDCFENSSLGTPDEFNLFVYQRALADRNVDRRNALCGVDRERYHLKRDSPAARKLTTIFARTWPMAKQMYYTLGFWTWKDQSSIPQQVRQYRWQHYREIFGAVGSRAKAG